MSIFKKVIEKFKANKQTIRPLSDNEASSLYFIGRKEQNLYIHRVKDSYRLMEGTIGACLFNHEEAEDIVSLNKQLSIYGTKELS